MSYMKSSSQVVIAKSDIGREDPLMNKRLTKYGKWFHLSRLLAGISRGRSSAATARRDTLAAFGIVTYDNSTTGTLRTTLNGVNIDVTATEEEVADAALMVAAINASTNALSYGGRVVEADNRAGTITLTSAAVGGWWDVCGYRFTAVAKTPNDFTQFELSGNDTADGDNLVTAINTRPGLNDLVFASNAAGVVTVRSRRASTASDRLHLLGSAEVVVDFAAVAVIAISAVHKGVSGNWITLAATGTGATAGGTRLASGTSTWETL